MCIIAYLEIIRFTSNIKMSLAFSNFIIFIYSYTQGLFVSCFFLKLLSKVQISN